MTSELLKSLISIPSPSREEKAVADFLEDWLRAHALGPFRHGNNLWCIKGNGPAILIDAHIDTVRPASGWETDPFTPIVSGERITGLGANDDGGSAVAMIKAFMQASPAKHTLVLSLSAEEEVSGKGGLEAALPAMQERVGAFECGIIGEPTGLMMATSEKGLMVLDCTAAGVSAHAASGKGVNAIEKAIPDIQWFQSRGMQVTQIQAGTQHNVIPDSCSFVVDVRTSGDNADVLEAVKRSVSCSVTPRSTRLCGSSIPENHPLVAAAHSLGIPTYSSPTLSNQALCRFPTVKIGPGESARSHSADEYILLTEVEAAVELYLKLLKSYEDLG